MFGTIAKILMFLFDKWAPEVIRLFIETEEQKKNRLSQLPILWLNGVSIRADEMRIDLNNKGEVAKIIAFKIISKDLVLHSLSLPYDLEAKERRYIFLRKINSKLIDSVVYSLEIQYLDRINNKYSVTIQGTGINAKLQDVKLLKRGKF